LEGNNNLFTLDSNNGDKPSLEARRAWRMALVLFISLAVHNFPEGLAVSASSMKDAKLGFTVMIGIMVHNVPEGEELMFK
jgi:zinc transporter, ZIP family